MNSLISFGSIVHQFSYHANSILKLEYDINAGANATVYVQLHDIQTPIMLAAGTFVPAVGTVPMKSWPAFAGSSGNYKEFKNGELSFANGVFVCISTTQSTFTVGTGNNKFDSVAVEMYNADITGSTVVQASNQAVVQTIWADGTSNKILRLAVTELNGDGSMRYVMLFAQAPTNNVSIPIEVWPLPSGVTILKTFSSLQGVGGLIPTSQDKNHVNHNGCYLAVSSSATVLSTDGPANFYVEYI